MEKKFFIFIGRSGSGKGTQTALLKEYLEKKGHTDVIHITTGGGFREFITQDNYIARLSKTVNETGGLQPEFLAVWNWANIFINQLKENETVILDGAPRKAFEASVLHSVVTFLEYKDPVVVYVDVLESFAKANLISRGREDDKNEKEVDAKMSWFEEDVLSALDVYIHDPRYKVLHVNGNQSIDEVHKELVEKLEKVS